MATGDVQNNVNRLRSELRKVKYDYASDLPEELLSTGDPAALLPPLHYALLGFSRHVAQKISARGYELQAKTDERFVECAFRLLREIFSYRPSLTTAQFFAKGFAERKLLLVIDVVKLCKDEHANLVSEQRLKAKPVPKASRLESVFPPRASKDRPATVRGAPSAPGAVAASAPVAASPIPKPSKPPPQLRAAEGRSSDGAVFVVQHHSRGEEGGASAAAIAPPDGAAAWGIRHGGAGPAPTPASLQAESSSEYESTYESSDEESGDGEEGAPSAGEEGGLSDEASSEAASQDGGGAGADEEDLAGFQSVAIPDTAETPFDPLAAAWLGGRPALQKTQCFSEVVKHDALTHDIARAFPAIKGHVAKASYATSAADEAPSARSSPSPLANRTNQQPTPSPRGPLEREGGKGSPGIAGMPAYGGAVGRLQSDTQRWLSVLANQMGALASKIDVLGENVAARFVILEGRLRFLEEVHRVQIAKQAKPAATLATAATLAHAKTTVPKGGRGLGVGESEREWLRKEKGEGGAAPVVVEAAPAGDDGTTPGFIAQVEKRWKQTTRLLDSLE